ncbi:MAG: hypothetical protein C4537_06420 [Acholeplasma sp.]|nr:MAG: hypothetical protein C4537_06420 [Acholeplasma sp.]
MSFMENYSDQEKIAIIVFLNMIVTSDLDVKLEELNLIWMFAQSMNIDLKAIDRLSDEEIKDILSVIGDKKLLEVLRMGYTMMSVDKKLKHQELSLIDYMASLHGFDMNHYKDFYKSFNLMSELTPLDQIVLVILAHYMVEADGIITPQEVQMLIVLCSMIGLDPEKIMAYKIPIDALYKAVKAMSPIAVRRVVEELLLISIADFKIEQAEYDLIFPILSYFHLDFEDVLRTAQERLDEHKEYYELFRTESEVN